MSKEQEYRLTPHQLGTVYGSGAFLLGLALSGLINNQIDASSEQRDAKEYEKTRAAIVEYADIIDEAEHNYIRLESDLSEGCRVLVRRYLADGELALEADDEPAFFQAEDDGTVANIDRAVDDALREPDQPCGDSASEIRTFVTRLSQEKDVLLETAPLLVEQQQALKAINTGDRNGPWFIFGGAVSAIGGLLFGRFIKGESSWQRSKRRRALETSELSYSELT